MKFTESALEQAIIELFLKQGFSHVPGGKLKRELTDVLIKDDLRGFLKGFNSKSLLVQKQIETLTKLRDTLLPQLISGKLKVPEGSSQNDGALKNDR